MSVSYKCKELYICLCGMEMGFVFFILFSLEWLYSRWTALGCTLACRLKLLEHYQRIWFFGSTSKRSQEVLDFPQQRPTRRELLSVLCTFNTSDFNDSSLKTISFAKSYIKFDSRTLCRECAERVARVPP